MEKLSLWSLIILIASIYVVESSSVHEPLLLRKSDHSSESSGSETVSMDEDKPVTQSPKYKLIPSEDDSQEMIRYFRITEISTEYYDDFWRDGPKSNFVTVAARKRLHDLIYELAVPIEHFDTDSFAKLIDVHKEDVGFCMRFHLVIMVLNRLTNIKILDGVNPSCFRTFVDLISGIHSGKDMVSIFHAENVSSKELVREQFHSFASKVNDFIMKLTDSRQHNFTLSLQDRTDLIASLRLYLNREERKIEFLL